MRVLVVEDDRDLADAIARGLRQAGLAVDVALDGEEALEKAAATTYAVVVLDRQLPGLPGDAVCRALLAVTPTPRVLMATASGEVDARIDGLALGADDYLPKPFVMAELVARVRALGRRPDAATPPILTVHDLVVYPAQRLTWRQGAPIALTRKEFGVLEAIMAAGGRVVSAEELLERVWDDAADPFTNAVRITMMTLRRKLGDPPLIETVVGVGYRLGDEPPP